jgi:hypothetical protein
MNTVCGERESSRCGAPGSGKFIMRSGKGWPRARRRLRAYSKPPCADWPRRRFCHQAHPADRLGSRSTRCRARIPHWRHGIRAIRN